MEEQRTQVPYIGRGQATTRKAGVTQSLRTMAPGVGRGRGRGVGRGQPQAVGPKVNGAGRGQPQAEEPKVNNQQQGINR